MKTDKKNNQEIGEGEEGRDHKKWRVGTVNEHDDEDDDDDDDDDEDDDDDDDDDDD